MSIAVPVYICFITSLTNKFVCSYQVKVRDILKLYYVIKRPGVNDFLEEVMEYYNICIYTSSEEEVNPMFDDYSHII